MSTILVLGGHIAWIQEPIRTVLQFEAVQAQQTLRATHYGTSYNGSPLGCPGYGTYSSSDPSIAAVGPPYYSQWPCGTVLELEGPAGTLVVIRQDSCPGCGSELIDLSEAGILQVCGSLGGCEVWTNKLR